jgi:hypothetical protein
MVSERDRSKVTTAGSGDYAAQLLGLIGIFGLGC